MSSDDRDYGFTFSCKSPSVRGTVSDVTLLLQQIASGDAQAGDKLLPLVYDELRRLAASKLAREAPGQTLQPTALVHEAWLRLGGDAQPSWQGRRHFLGAAAEAMRRILVDRARHRGAARHGGGWQRIDLPDGNEPVDPGIEADERVLALHEALERLATQSPQKAELVKLRYFVGLSIEEAAAALEISVPTANRWWAFARAWLLEAVNDASRQTT